WILRRAPAPVALRVGGVIAIDATAGLVDGEIGAAVAVVVANDRHVAELAELCVDVLSGGGAVVLAAEQDLEPALRTRRARWQPVAEVALEVVVEVHASARFAYIPCAEKGPPSARHGTWFELIDLVL